MEPQEKWLRSFLKYSLSLYLQIAHRASYRNIFKQDSFKDNLLKDTECQENLVIYESIDNTFRQQKNSSSEEEIVLKDIVKELPKRHSEDMLKNIIDTTVGRNITDTRLGRNTRWFLRKSGYPTSNKSPVHSEIVSVPWKGSQEEQMIRIVSPIETSSESSTNLSNGGAVPEYVSEMWRYVCGFLERVSHTWSKSSILGGRRRVHKFVSRQSAMSPKYNSIYTKWWSQDT